MHVSTNVGSCICSNSDVFAGMLMFSGKSGFILACLDSQSPQNKYNRIKGNDLKENEVFSLWAIMALP